MNPKRADKAQVDALASIIATQVHQHGYMRVAVKDVLTVLGVPDAPIIPLLQGALDENGVEVTMDAGRAAIIATPRQRGAVIPKINIHYDTPKPIKKT